MSEVNTLAFVVLSLGKLCVLFPKRLLSKAYTHSNTANANQKEKKNDQPNKRNHLSDLCALPKISTFIFLSEPISPSRAQPAPISRGLCSEPQQQQSCSPQRFFPGHSRPSTRTAANICSCRKGQMLINT